MKLTTLYQSRKYVHKLTTLICFAAYVSILAREPVNKSLRVLIKGGRLAGKANHADSISAKVIKSPLQLNYM